MRIACIEIANFRKLKSVRIDLSEQTTLLVGANNSGKTTAMDALRQFLFHGSAFRITDLTLSDLPKLNVIGEIWEHAAGLPVASDGVDHSDDPDPTIQDLEPYLPTLDVWIEADEAELYRVRQLLPILKEYRGAVGVRLRWEPRDLEQLRLGYLGRRRAVLETLGVPGNSNGDDRDGAAGTAEASETPLRLWPADLVDYLDRKLTDSFHVSAYKLDPDKLQPPLAVGSNTLGFGAPTDPVSLQQIPPAEESLESNPLAKLIRVDIVNAQRGLGNDEGNGRLSKQVSAYYSRHLDFDQKPEPGDLKAIGATQEASRLFDERLKAAFAIPLAEIAKMGYPGGSDPRVVIKTSLRLTDGLQHDSVLKYQMGATGIDGETTQLELPEGMNGLGYQNLVLMIFNLMSFRDARLRVGKASISIASGSELPEIAPIHLVLIEEPEAHLHAQVQQVFINRAYKTLTETDGAKQPGLKTQLVVSTHSSHIAHEVDFAAIRYFKRNSVEHEHEIPTTTVRNLSAVFGNETATAKFVQRYLKVQHCNIFFADALVLMEGAAERILLPYFVEEYFEKLHQSYVEYLDIGGAHAHRLRGLIDAIGIPTLVITDIDAVSGDSSSAVAPIQGAGHKTSNAALTKWLSKGNDMDVVLGLNEEEKILGTGDSGRVRFAYQGLVSVSAQGQAKGTVVPSTFEDSLAFTNVDFIAATGGVGLTKKIGAHLATLSLDGALESIAEELFKELKSGDKAKFALDVLWAIPERGVLITPAYIAEGLAWLQDEVGKLPLVPGVSVANSAPVESSTETETNNETGISSSAAPNV